jgi:hypothetical protein
MSPRQIDALAQFIDYRFKGRGEATYEECIEFFGANAATCGRWPTRAEVAAGAVPALQLTELWRIGGFAMPESVSFDLGTGTLFVSNINSPDFMPNGLGYISQVGVDGTIINERFVDGLSTPVGTYVRDGSLWVVAGGLVEIDIATATVVNTYTAEGLMFPNDVFAAEDGRVFVTDVIGSAIWVLENGTLSMWLQDPMLAGVNGITIVEDTMYLATLGDMTGGFENLQPSNVKTVNMATKTVADYGSPAGIGGFDGIEPMEGGMMVTDNSGGRLLMVAPGGTVTVLVEPGNGAADHEYVPQESLVVIPMLNSGELIGYRVSR